MFSQIVLSVYVRTIKCLYNPLQVCVSLSSTQAIIYGIRRRRRNEKK